MSGFKHKNGFVSLTSQNKQLLNIITYLYKFKELLEKIPDVIKK